MKLNFHNLIFCAVAEYRFNDLKYEYSNLTNLHLGSIYYNKILKKDGKQAYKDLSFPLIGIDSYFCPST